MTKDLRYRAAEWLIAGPFRARLYLSLRRSMHHSLVRSDTRLVIEGFPRSANSYAITAFWITNGQDIPVADHLHSPVNVELGVKKALPVLVLIRDPVDAVASLMLRATGMSARNALGRYIRFHRRVLALRGDVLVAPFEVVVSDFGLVLSELNRRFGTSFKPYEKTPANEARVKHEVEWAQYVTSGKSVIAEDAVPRPSASREVKKPQIVAEVLNQRDQLMTARSLYDQMMSAVPGPLRVPLPQSWARSGS